MRTRLLSSVAAIGFAALVVSPGMFGTDLGLDRWPGVYVLEASEQTGTAPPTRRAVSVTLSHGGAARAQIRSSTVVGFDFDLVLGDDGVETEGDQTPVWRDVASEWVGRWSPRRSGVDVRLTRAGGTAALRFREARNGLVTTSAALRPLLGLGLPDDMEIWFQRRAGMQAAPPPVDRESGAPRLVSRVSRR